MPDDTKPETKATKEAAAPSLADAQAALVALDEPISAVLAQFATLYVTNLKQTPLLNVLNALNACLQNLTSATQQAEQIKG
jgi:hypothetical protein